MSISRVQISTEALMHNTREFRRVVGDDVRLVQAVKGNAYGHGIVECSRVFVEAGVDALGVDNVDELEALRNAGVVAPVVVLGYTPVADLLRAVKLGCELTVYNVETLEGLRKIGGLVQTHLKIETGNHRQGVNETDLPRMIELYEQFSNVELTGVSTHFANMEDTEEHEYALRQLRVFESVVEKLVEVGHAPRFRHCANTAASILLPEAHFNMVRVGIGGYGLWPSEKTLKAAQRAGIEMELRPAMCWVSMVAQIKEVPAGALIGYGCTHEMSAAGRIAVVPVGYYDGYVRAHSNKGYVLIRGKEAPIVGRICMNMMMVDISEVEGVQLEDEVVLLGKGLSAEQLGEWSGTINYEVTTRVNEGIPRGLI